MNVVSNATIQNATYKNASIVNSSMRNATAVWAERSILWDHISDTGATRISCTNKPTPVQYLRWTYVGHTRICM